MKKKLFLALYWVLTFTWALPTTILGSIVALGLLITGHKPYVFCSGLCFPVAEDWGLELGVFFIGAKDKDIPLAEHEYGHHLQACFLLGPLTLFVATIPSIARFWLREAESKKMRRVAVLVFFLIMMAVCGAFVGMSFLFSCTVLSYIAFCAILPYACIVSDWLLYLAKRYDEFGLDEYDDFWVEGDASRRGKKIHEKYFPTTY